MESKTLRMLLGISVAVLAGSGCSHQLEVKNLRSYQNMQINPLHRPMIIGVVPSTEDIDSQRLMKGVGTGLQKYSATVILPYFHGSAAKADVIANVAIRPDYRGSGWNFLINWPGFLIWTPAWHGYVYKVDYVFDVMLTKGTDNTKIDSWSIPVKLNLRHAEMDRTWTEIGWLEVGIIPLIGGIIFTSYDPDVTQILVDKIEVPIGDFIAQEIISRLNNCGHFAVVGPLGSTTGGGSATAMK